MLLAGWGVLEHKIFNLLYRLRVDRRNVNHWRNRVLSRAMNERSCESLAKLVICELTRLQRCNSALSKLEVLACDVVIKIISSTRRSNIHKVY